LTEESKLYVGEKTARQFLQQMVLRKLYIHI
jgi:hypothetical protein